MIKSAMIKARTALALGLPNLARVLTYRLGVKFGLNPVRRIRAPIPAGLFFTPLFERIEGEIRGLTWRNPGL